MSDTIREALESCDYWSLLALGKVILTLASKKTGHGTLDIDVPFSEDGGLNFRPSKSSTKFQSAVQVLSDYLPNKDAWNLEKMKGLDVETVMERWDLLTNDFLRMKLLEVAALRERRGDKRSRDAHRKGANIVATFKTPITSGEQAQKVKGIGPKIAEKIDLLLQNGDLDELLEEAEVDRIIKLFSFWGSSTETAREWYDKGYRTIEDLRTAFANDEITLSKMQKLSLEHFEDFDVQMSITDAQHIVKLVKASVPKGFETILVGSFRRGKKASKDCDILVIGEKKGHQTSTTILNNLKQIAEVKIASEGQQVFMGLIKMPAGIWKRVDVFVASEDERGCSLLAHTGPAMYNIKMRAAAKERGWILNEKHLIDQNGDIIETKTEADVQRILEFPIEEPSERN